MMKFRAVERVEHNAVLSGSWCAAYGQDVCVLRSQLQILHPNVALVTWVNYMVSV